jgi:hypothetical protein
MRKTMTETWVVYRMPVKDCPEGRRAVCEQGEWAAMDSAKPGVYTMIRAGMTNEGEAERLARGTSGARIRRNPSRTLTACPASVDSAAATAATAA